MALSIVCAKMGRRRAICACQGLQYSAVLCCLGNLTLRAQRFQLALQYLKFGNAPFHMSDMQVEEMIDFTAIIFGMVTKPEHVADFVERHVERPAMPDELQPFDLLRTIQTVIILRTRGSG